MLLRLFLAFVPLATAVIVPRPNGTYSVGAHVAEVVDNSRTYQGKPRTIVTTTFFPVGAHDDCLPYLNPYLPEITADFVAGISTAIIGLPVSNATINSLELQLCTSNTSTDPSATPWPMALFSSGLGIPREFYSALNVQLASQGFVAVTIDSPGSTLIEVYTNNTSVLGQNITDTAQHMAAIQDRTKDISFVRTQALDGTLAPFLSIDPNRTAVWGHSFGGGAAAQAVASDPSLKGGIDLDGGLWEPVASTGVTRPFLLFSHDGHNTSNTPSWASFQGNSTGTQLEISLIGSQHDTFTDLPLLANLTDILPRNTTTVAAELIGTIPAHRASVVIVTYVDAFFRFCFGEKTPDILQGPSPEFPEVVFVSQSTS